MCLQGTTSSAHEQFMVIDTCAGLRFMEVLTLLAVVYAGWSPGGRLRTLLRVALAPPIAYFFNLLRVCLLMTHPASELSSMHSIQGWGVFLAAVTCFVYVDRLLLGRLPGCARPPAGGTPPRPLRTVRGSRAEDTCPSSSFARLHDSRSKADRDHGCLWRSLPGTLNEPVLTGAADSSRVRGSVREQGIRARTRSLKSLDQYTPHLAT